MKKVRKTQPKFHAKVRSLLISIEPRAENVKVQTEQDLAAQLFPMIGSPLVRKGKNQI